MFMPCYYAEPATSPLFRHAAAEVAAFSCRFRFAATMMMLPFFADIFADADIDYCR